VKKTLFTCLHILLLIFVVGVSSLIIVEMIQHSANMKQQLKYSFGQTEEINKLQSELESAQQTHSQISSQINLLQSNCSDLQAQVTKIEQLKAAAKSKVAYLTFDDGPSSLTAHVLDILKSNDAHATFFVVGEYAVKYPDIIKQTYSEGNSIGNHTWTHDYSVIYKSEADFLNDFNRNQTYLTDLLGVAPLVCRYPGGTSNTVSQHYSDHVMRLIDPDIKARGLKPYDWDAYAGDAESGPKPSKDTIIHNVMNDAAKYKYPVILFHDTSVNSNDLPALPEIIAQLRNDGYTFGVLTPSTPDCQFKPY
jgi:peptidoglycan/xylan/chitin deacetylase (PgdA/CDA1 family)